MHSASLVGKGLKCSEILPEKGQISNFLPKQIQGHGGAPVAVLSEQEEWDRGRWVGTPKGYKQHGHVWAWP